ncbi:MAG: hypothetical protein KIS66_02745 [Fimbriimonadaceae bacterium]|nr:hypothetical protein [Fimbriimonadaceae bacterium]
MASETLFERRRGISRVEVRSGLAQVHVGPLGEPLMARRLDVLRVIAAAGISIDFLKLTQSGLSFIIPAERSEATEATLAATDLRYTVRAGRSIVLAHAVNMRDEEGLIARIVRSAIEEGVEVDHIGDMHDRVLMVVPDDAAERLRTSLERNLGVEA